MSIAIKQPRPLRERPRLEISKPVDNIAGRQYRVSDDLWTHIVTLVNGCIHCSGWIGFF